MRYNWQQPDWPDFRYDLAAVTAPLLTFAEHTGRIDGLLEGLPTGLDVEAILDVMIAEATESSAIEGEILDRDAVRSSIRNHLGLNSEPELVKNRMAAGAGELMVAVRSTFQEPLTRETLFAWHRMLLGSTRGIQIGQWRVGNDPMQIVSGNIGRPKVHFEAPPSASIPLEMERFLTWFAETAPGGSRWIAQTPVRAAIAHLYFESIHPFEDGNGRIGRAIADKALSQGLGRPVMLSLSRTIEADRSAYYGALETAQRSNEVTPWLVYFIETALSAQRDSEAHITFILQKSKFFQRFNDRLGERQLRVIRRMFEAGPAGFEGGMSARKYVGLTGVSKATATRDLQLLAEMEALVPIGSGRAARYELKL
jgi:Fic family protein